MSNRIHYSLCPLCGSTSIYKVLKAKDNTVSGEEFAIYQCEDCTLRFTQDVPDMTSISRYYKSENYISHTNTSKGLVNLVYHIVRRRSIVQKRKMIERFTGMRRGDLLELGSGTGTFAAAMQKAGWTVTGLEPDEHARHVALQENGITLKPIDLLFQLRSASYDVITLWHVLEHVHDLPGYVKQIRNLLKPDGRLFIAVPNYTSFDSHVYDENWAAYDVPRHLYHFSPESIERLMKLEKMALASIKPLWYDSFYVSLLSSRYKKGHTSWLSALWTGLLSNLKALENKNRCSSLIYIIRKAEL